MAGDALDADPELQSQMDAIAVLLTVLQHIHTYAFTTKSDLARQHADIIAEAASKGLISTAIVPGSAHCGHIWKITTKGLTLLTGCYGVIEEQELRAYSNKGAAPSYPVDPEVLARSRAE